MTYFDTNMSRFSLVGLSMEALFDFQMFIYQMFAELQGWNSEFNLISPKYIMETQFGTLLAILDYTKRLYLNWLKSYRTSILNLT